MGPMGGAGRLGLELADTQVLSTSDEIKPSWIVHDWLAALPKQVRIATCPLCNKVRHQPFIEDRISPACMVRKKKNDDGSEIGDLGRLEKLGTIVALYMFYCINYITTLNKNKG